MMKSLRAALLPWLFVGLSAAEPEGVSLVAKLAAGNDSLIRAALASGTDRPGAVLNHREAATRLLVYACGLVSPASRHHREPALLAALADVVARLAAAQHPSGLFDSGNLESPPDTAFILEALAKVQLLLRAEARAETEALRAVLLPVLRRAAAAVAAGGVHTPNHRWGVCAALALVHEIEPDPRYPARISEWLAEGIDQDADGQYSERSPAYSAKVVNPALLTLIEREGLEALAEEPGGRSRLPPQRRRADVGDPLNRVMMPAFTTFDAMASYAFTLGGRRVSAQLNVKNVADKLYRDGTDGYFANRREWVVSVRSRF